MAATVCGSVPCVASIPARDRNHRIVVRKSLSTFRRQTSTSRTIASSHEFRFRAGLTETKSLHYASCTLGSKLHAAAGSSGQFRSAGWLQRSKQALDVRRMRGTYCASSLNGGDNSNSSSEVDAKNADDSQAGALAREKLENAAELLKGKRDQATSEAAASEATKQDSSPQALLATRFWRWLVGVFSVFHLRARRLKQLKADCDQNPSSAALEALYLAELGKHEPAGVVKRFESTKLASNSDCVVEYLRALVATGNLTKYHSEAQAEGNQKALTILLGGLQKRAEGDLEAPLKPGDSPTAPLHIMMSASPEVSRPFRWLQDLLWNIALMLVMAVVWVVGSNAMRKYMQQGGTANPVGAGASSVQAPSSYSPKEYNKENMPEQSVKTFADVKGCDEAKAELEEIVQYLKNPAKFTRLGGRLPKGVLLTGPPGTGKTLLARAVAGEANVPFYYRAGSEFEEMFVGVGSRRVRSLFAAAKKKTPCIIFIDEIDAIGASRKSWESHTRKTLNQLLVEMDGFETNEGIIVLAATNLPETLDTALTRPGRFDRHISVPPPDMRGRKEILEFYLGDKPVADDVNAETLARGTPGFSGADLFNLVNVAAIQAAILDADKINTSMMEFAKDRIMMGCERKSAVISEENRKLTAYHEGGHALVAIHTKGALPVHKATIVPRGNALGLVMQLPDKDSTSISMKQMLAKLDVCMGGRVAEEMIFGPEQVTSGATSDLKQATNIARYMVTKCGMSELVGPMFIELGKGGPNGGSGVSPETERNIDLEVTRLLKEAYVRVTSLLKEKEAELHTLAAALLDKETLNGQEIKEALSGMGKLVDTSSSSESPTGGSTDVLLGEEVSGETKEGGAELAPEPALSSREAEVR